MVESPGEKMGLIFHNAWINGGRKGSKKTGLKFLLPYPSLIRKDQPGAKGP